jgi:hypothetical protein
MAEKAFPELGLPAEVVWSARLVAIPAFFVSFIINFWASPVVLFLINIFELN